MGTPLTSALLLSLFMLPTFLTGSGSITGFLTLLAALGIPFLLLSVAYRHASTKLRKSLAVVLAAAFFVVDIPLFFGAGLATPIVGLVQSIIAAATAATFWIGRKRDA